MRKMSKKAYAVFDRNLVKMVTSDRGKAMRYFLSFSPERRKRMFVCVKSYSGILSMKKNSWTIIEAGDCTI